MSFWRKAWHVLVVSGVLGLLLASGASRAQAPFPATGTVEVAFTPWDDAEGAILRALGSAQREIYVQAYLFTSRNLAQGLLAASRRGVKVEMLVDREMLLKGENSQVPRLARLGIPVWLETRYAVAHNKILLIDPQEASAAVVTGSYNYTYSAQARNAENLLVLRGNPTLTRVYFENWQRHRSEAVPYEVSREGGREALVP